MPLSGSTISYDQPREVVERIITNVEKVLIGKQPVIEQAVIALLCGGHILLEDVPGVGKTMLIRALAQTIGASYKRIQFTPDMLPSDVTGFSMFNQKTGQFEFRQGPIMANMILADELNRASPKTQAALLEAMEEKNVTVDGTTYALPRPFLLLATQNPLEYEGTFPLPEAQLDRFLLKLRLGYPDERQELDMLARISDRHPIDSLQPIVTLEQFTRLQQQAAQVFVDDTLKHYIVSMIQSTRKHRDLLIGASPRASLALMKTAQARAYVRGRNYAIPDDIKAMTVSTLAHRIMLTPEARMNGKTAESALLQIAGQIVVPDIRRGPHQVL